MKAARAAVRQAKALEGQSEDLQAVREQMDRLEAKLDALLAANGLQAPADGADMKLVPPAAESEADAPDTDDEDKKPARRGRRKEAGDGND